MSLFMGIDVGTSSVKVLICDEAGKEISFASQQYDIEIPQQGYAQQDMDHIWEQTIISIKEAISSLSCVDDIKGIGFSGQMHGIVPVDQCGKVIDKAIIWADQRSIEEMEALNQEAYQKINGNRAATGFYGCSLLWLKKHRLDIYQKIDKALLPKDYIRYKMCGVLGSDYSDASATFLFDIEHQCWSEMICSEMGIDMNILPELHASSDICGNVSEECAKLTGLSMNSIIVYGGGDQQMQLIGNGVIQPGTAVANIATSSQIVTVLDSCIHDPNYRTNTFVHALRDRWTIMGACLNGGSALKWIRNNLSITSFDECTRLAKLAPAGSDSLIFLPYLCGERTPHMDPNAKAIFFGLSLSHTSSHMIRAVMEGVVFALKDCIDILEDLNISFDTMIATGGASQHDFWVQLQADIFGKEIHRSKTKEAACLGAGITAAYGLNVYSSLHEAIKQMTPMTNEVFTPNQENHQIYQKQFKKYKQLYENNKNLLEP